LEALNYSLPVLASNIPSNLEIIKNNGFNFHSGNSTDLYKKLKYILSLPQESIKKIGAIGQKIIARRYNWEVVAKNTEKIYKSLLARSPQPRIVFQLKIKEV
jgi:glycosyltransferase involved in cell wall biosynthesis